MCQFCEQDGGARMTALSRRRFLGAAAALTAGLGSVTSGHAEALKAPPKPQNAVSPDGALELLHKGNDRYVEGVSKRHDFLH